MMLQTYSSITDYSNTKPSVVTIGTFDGVHIGHKKIIKRLTDIAHKEQLASVVLTFFPHPRMVLQKDNSIELLNTMDEKKAILDSIGLAHLVVHPFTYEFSRLTAQEFVETILVKQLNIKKIIIGYDHRFGRDRNADINDLKRYGKQHGFDVEEISAQQLDDVSVSSTKIRNALKKGNIATANAYLGYPYALSGVVTRGKGLGKTIGFPTANLHLTEDYKLIPKNGVYVSQAKINNALVYGLTSIGTNPTVGGVDKTIETYFLNVSQDLYDQPLTIELLTKIRDEEKFDSVASLQTAIKNDEQFARNYLAL